MASSVRLERTFKVLDGQPLPVKALELPGWRAALAPSGDGYLGDERNILIALRTAPELAGLVRLNQFALTTEFTRSPPWRQAEPGQPFRDGDSTELAAWLQQMGLKVRGIGAIDACVTVVAGEHAYNPVAEYFSCLVWDGTPRLASWPQVYLNAAGTSEYLAAVGMRFLISAVARVFQPGCQADHVLVLEGPQGGGKTSAARALAVKPEWFAGSLPDIANKDAALQLCGRLIIEIAELKAFKNSQTEAIKTFLTQTIDTFRPPYGRRTGQFPRQCVFIGTTNETTYLRDRTGNRRYWPIKCGVIDVAALTRDRDALWAEAVHRYGRGAAWHLDEAETRLANEEQHERVQISELEQDVAAYLSQRTDQRQDVTVRDVLIYALHLDPDAASYTETARKFGPAVADALEASGWQKVGRIGKGNRTTYRRRQG